MTDVMEQISAPLLVKIAFEQVENQVLLAVSPDSKGEPLNETLLRQALAQEDFGDFYLSEEAIDDALALDWLEDPQVFQLAEKRDCDIKIEISTEEMDAYMTVKPAYGGQVPTEELLLEVLKQKGIVYGIRKDTLQQIVQKGQTQTVLIAKGDLPEHGQNTQFNYLIENTGPPGKPQILEDGRVDFSELNIVTSVEAGTPLMRRIPATEGQPGRSVRGQIMPQVKGKEKAFGVGKGGKIDEQDANLLIATVSGQAKPRPTTVNVEAVFDIERVSQETGNINFAGTIRIRNQIEAGFKVHAEGDLIVGGAVEATDIQVDGDALFESGVVGKEKGSIYCGGSLTAKFIESCTMQITGKIDVVDAIVNSHLTCFDSIDVGMNMGRGQIIGGKICAYHAIQARIAGSAGGGHTFLQVGIHPALQAEQKKLKLQLATYKKQFDETIKALIYRKTHKGNPQEIRDLDIKREELLYKINVMNEEQQLLKRKLEESAAGAHYIQIIDKIYSGTVFSISGYTRIFEEDRDGGRFILEKGQVVLSSHTGSDGDAFILRKE